MPQAQTYQSEFTGLEMDARFAAVAQLTDALEALTAVVAQKYVKPASGIPSTDMDADVQAALAKANTAIQSLADYYTKSEVDQLLAAINGMEYVDVAALPTASASTMGKIYLVGPDASGYYAYYYTSYDGSAYSWVGPLGTTEISLAGYATKAELSQLDQKVDVIVEEVQVQSPNLFDKSTAVDGRALDARDGTSFSSSGYSYSDYIAIPEGTTAMYINKSIGAGIRGYAMYNSSKVYTHGSSSSTTTPDIQMGDAYIRFTFNTADKDTCMAIIGTQADLPPEYVPYGTITSYAMKDNIVEFNNIAFKVAEAGKNKLNPATVTAGKYIDRTDGTLATYTGDEPTSATDYIAASPEGLYFNYGIRAGNYIGAAVYDSAKRFIREVGPQNYYYQAGDAWVRFSFRSANLALAQVEVGNVGTQYEDYTEREVIAPQYLPTSQEQPDELKISLPDKLYAVVGDTLQVFFQSCVRSVDVSNYNVRVSCAKGRQFRRYFEYTPENGDIGSTTLRLTVMDDFGNTLATKDCTLVTVAAGTSPASLQKVVCVGASTTANGKWPAEAFRRLTGSGGTPAGLGKTNIEFCGIETKDGAGFVGRSGWGWVDYCTAGRPAFRFTIETSADVAVNNVYTNNGYSYTIIEISDDGTILCSTSSASNTPQASGTLTKTSGSGDATVTFTASAADSQNPFWDYQNEKLTFEPFADAYCDGQIDALYVWLGTNGLSSWQTDFSACRGYMEDFVDTLHAEFPNAKIYLLFGTVPSMKLMMPGYGASGAGWADTFGMVDSMFNLRDFYQDFANEADYSGFVEFVDGTAQFDSDYNFPLTEKDVNTRNSSFQEPYANNTVHPGDPGYMQVADAVFRHYVAKFCQS